MVEIRRTPLPYEKPAPQDGEAEPRPLISTLTVRATLATLVAFLATLAAKRYGVEVPVELQEAIVAIGVSAVAIGMRRALVGLALACSLALSGCATPDLRPTLTATRATLQALRADYTRGRLVIPGAKPETMEALRAQRVEEIDAADAALRAAEEASK